jgi:hypothetical protein
MRRLSRFQPLVSPVIPKLIKGTLSRRGRIGIYCLRKGEEENEGPKTLTWVLLIMSMPFHESYQRVYRGFIGTNESDVPFFLPYISGGSEK